MAMNMNCPRCGAQLVHTIYEGKISFHCPYGHGHAVTLSAVRALCGRPEFANILWRKALQTNGGGGGCPICGRPMALVRVPVAGQELELDICCRCQELWFDPLELEALPRPLPPPQRSELPQRAKVILAHHAIEEMQSCPVDSEPDNAWGYVAGLLGFPVEVGAPSRYSLPWITWGLALLCVVVYVFSWGNLSAAAQEWGLIPQECFRKNGATFITSMFLHGGLFHLIGNLYFLLIFGDNVEDALGKLKYLALLLASGLVAGLLHITFFPGSSIPCVGASGFISGIIAAYAIFFPKVSISLFFRIGLYFRWLSMPAWGAFVLWMLYQGTMALLSYFADLGSGVAYGAHLGGAVVGCVAGFFLRKQVQNRLKELES